MKDEDKKRKVYVKSHTSFSSIKNPFERCIDILTNLRDEIEDKPIVRNLSWILDVMNDGSLLAEMKGDEEATEL